MKKTISRLFLICAIIFIITLPSDVYSSPFGPGHDALNIPITPLPIIIDDCDDGGGQGGN